MGGYHHCSLGKAKLARVAQAVGVQSRGPQPKLVGTMRAAEASEAFAERPIGMSGA